MARAGGSSTALLLVTCSFLLCTKDASALFGFGSGNGDEIKKSSPYGCLGWRQTKNCDPVNGEREPNNDRKCNERVPRGASGYCECVFGTMARTTCAKNRGKIRCDLYCKRGFESLENTDESTEWIVDTVWHWNNWREVVFHAGGSFYAPTPDCESGECFWAGRKGKIYIMWGNAGMHTVRAVDSAKKRIEGMRFNGEACFGVYVRGMDGEEGGGGDEEEEDLYELLGVDVEATDSDIRKAYRKLSKELHPDTYVGDDKEAAEQRFIKIQRAYEILKDDETRMVYDTGGMEAIEQISKGDEEQGMDPFSMFFGGGNRGGSKRGQSVKAQLEVSLEDMYNGGEVGAQYARRVVCRNCRKITKKNKERCQECGRCPPEIKMVQKQMGGFIVQQQEQVPSKERCKQEQTVLNALIEKGMDSGQEIVFERMGEQTPGQIPGDVILVLEQAKHERFHRSGNDLKTTVHISLKEALTGFTLTFAHLDGREIVIEKKAGQIISPLEIQTMKKEGMPLHNTPSEHGDLHLEYEIEFPQSLTAKQIEELKAVLPD